MMYPAKMGVAVEVRVGDGGSRSSRSAHRDAVQERTDNGDVK